MQSDYVADGATWTNKKWYLYKVDSDFNFATYSCYEVDPYIVPDSDVISFTVAETGVHTTEDVEFSRLFSTLGYPAFTPNTNSVTTPAVDPMLTEDGSVGADSDRFQTL